MEEAIKLAIEGGYDANDYPLNLPKDYMHDIYCLIWIDPLFWQALGKSVHGKEGDLKIKNGFGETISREASEKRWKEDWHRFIDHLASGKDVDSFFSALLNT